MFRQFHRAGCQHWLNGSYDALLNAFPMLREFPYVDRKVTTEILAFHELGHMMQFMANSEQDRLLIDNFGWDGTFFGPTKSYKIANREAEVYAFQHLFYKFFPEHEPDVFEIPQVSSMCALLETGLTTQAFRDPVLNKLVREKEPYWQKCIKDNMEKFEPIFHDLANRTFSFIVENKNVFVG